MAEEEPGAPRRLPGGALPRHLVRPGSPPSNGHHGDPVPARDSRHPLGGVGPGWADLDAADDAAARASGRTEFRRVLDEDAGRQSRGGRGPSLFVVGLLLIVALVVLVAVLLYRSAPP